MSPHESCQFFLEICQSLELRWAAVSAAGSQFRSRDLFPQAAAAIASGQPGALADEIRTQAVPDTPPNRVAYIDGYGNLKTTIPAGAASLPTGTQLRVRVGDAEQDVTASDGSFAVEPGRLAFAPGSSSWATPRGEALCWMELFLCGSNAWRAFARPSVGDTVEIIRAS